MNNVAQARWQLRFISQSAILFIEIHCKYIIVGLFYKHGLLVLKMEVSFDIDDLGCYRTFMI